MPETNYIAENLRAVRSQIAQAADKANRAAEEITLIAVSKTHPSEILQTAIAAGANHLGENKVQEAAGKVAEIGRSAANWHLIGNLQANKARKAVQSFDLIHTLDSIELARRLERICQEESRDRLEVLIQVDLAREATKSGVTENDLPNLVAVFNEFEHLKLRGLMILPPFFDEPELARPYFRRLREIRDELQNKNVFGDKAGELSMGMSNDFAVAIEEGATLVRVGTAIFGKRENLKSEI